MFRVFPMKIGPPPLVIMLTVMVRNSLSNSQPDPHHDDPIHRQITFQKNHVFNSFHFFIF